MVSVLLMLLLTAALVWIAGLIAAHRGSLVMHAWCRWSYLALGVADVVWFMCDDPQLFAQMGVLPSLIVLAFAYYAVYLLIQWTWARAWRESYPFSA